MSLHPHKNGTLVKWRDDTGKQCSRVFKRKGDAERWDTDLKRRKQLGHLAGEVFDAAGTMTLAQFVAGPWRTHIVGMAPNTRAKYAWALEKHCKPLLDLPLTELTVPTLAKFQHDMLSPEKGKPATPNTTREVLSKLGAVLQIAVEHGGLMPRGNPAHGLRKVKQHARAEKDALTPRELETLIGGVVSGGERGLRGTLAGRTRAILVLGGRLGLRPEEIVAVPWSGLQDGYLRISATETKATSAHFRAIKLDKLSAQALREWQLESGGRGKDRIVPMTNQALKLWGTRTLRKRIREVTGGRIEKGSTYTLRHTHASALHYAAFTLPEAARRMGHKPETHLRHYAHVLAMLPEERYPSLDALYAAARQPQVAALGEHWVNSR